VATLADIERVVESYCVRWMIEVFFRTLKSGCRVESRRFETLDRMLNCVVVYLIVTWRTLFVCRLARELPHVSCEVVFDQSEWKPIFPFQEGTPPPEAAPTLREMVYPVSRLGGYVNRARGGEPGPQTVWRGLKRLHDIAQCWIIFGPGAKTKEQLLV